MKNKHLVLLFLGVLVAGLLARRLPWPAKKFFQTDLIALDTASVTRIVILQTGDPELSLERTEAGWAATEELRSVAVRQEQIAPILAALAAARSLRIVQTDRPDTLGFLEKNRLQVLVFQENKTLEQFEIGNEILENGQPATFIRLLPHEGIYLVEKHLRGVFSKKFDDFRLKTVAQFEPSEVRAITIENSTSGQIFLQKNDSTTLWENAEEWNFSNDSVQTWLQFFGLLNGSPFADHFDESRAQEPLLSKITLRLISSDSLIFKVFYAKSLDLPEEISMKKTGDWPLYILHSSQNPSNFFALPDTSLLRRIFIEPVFFKITENGN